MLICVVVRDFVAQYEQKLQPDLKASPLLIYQQKGSKRTVYATCEKARQLGVIPAMTKSQARGLCPEAREVDVHLKAYQLQADTICRVLLRFTDKIEYEQASNLTIWLDSGKLSPTESYKLAGYVQHELLDCFALTSSIGITAGRWSSRTAAYITPPNNIRCLPPEKEQAVLWKLEINQFTLPKRFHEQCHHLGLGTLGQFARLPWNDVRMRFGDVGAQLHRLAHGFDRHTLEAYRIVEPVEHYRYFDGVVEDKRVLQSAISEMASEMAAELSKHGLSCNDLSLTLHCEDRTRLEITRPIREPIQSEKLLQYVLLQLLDQLSPKSGIERFSIILDKLLPPQPQQLNFFGTLFKANDEENILKTTLQRLQMRHPDIRCYQFQISETPTDLPEQTFVIESITAA